MTGFISDLPFSQYLKIPALSASGIKLFLESPAKYDMQKRGLYKHESTKAQKLGSAFEILVLEPEKSANVIVTECVTEAAKEYKEAMKNNPDKIVLTAGDGADVKRWAECCSGVLFENNIRGIAQLSAITEFCDADFSDLAVKCRFDLINHETQTIYDLKLMANAGPEQFAKDAYKFGYHIQSWWYRKIAETLTGNKYRFKFIVQEKHDFGTDDRFTGIYEFYESDDDFIQSVIVEAIRKIKKSETLGEYAGYGQKLISIPAWARSNV